MSENTNKQYTNGEITVVWKPSVCVHSTLCWKGLSEVFNPHNRPWINMKGASTAQIIEQVNKCPSGALSYFRNDDKPENSSNEESITLVEVAKNGPLLVHGNITIKDADGNETRKSKVTALCRCGASSNKPYCDGTHRKINFEG